MFKSSLMINVYKLFNDEILQVVDWCSQDSCGSLLIFLRLFFLCVCVCLLVVDSLRCIIVAPFTPLWVYVTLAISRTVVKSYLWNVRTLLISAFSHPFSMSLIQVQGSRCEGYLPKPFPLLERKRDSVGMVFSIVQSSR